MANKLVQMCVSKERAEHFVSGKVDTYEIKQDGSFWAVWLILDANEKKDENITVITIEYDSPLQYTKQGEKWIESFTFIDYSNSEMRIVVMDAKSRGIEVSYN